MEPPRKNLSLILYQIGGKFFIGGIFERVKMNIQSNFSTFSVRIGSKFTKLLAE